MPEYKSFGLDTVFSIPLRQQKYALVDPSTGEITAHSKGVVTVNAIVGDGKMARKSSIKVKIYDPFLVGASTVRCKRTTTMKVIGGQKKTNWSVENETGSAMIDSKGRLRALSAGTVIVKAENNGKCMDMVVTIVP